MIRAGTSISSVRNPLRVSPRAKRGSASERVRSGAIGGVPAVMRSSCDVRGWSGAGARTAGAGVADPSIRYWPIFDA